MHKLQIIRESRNMTQRDLSVATEVCPTTIYRIEAEDPTVRVYRQSARRIAFILGVDVDELFDPLELVLLWPPPPTHE